MRGFRVFFVLWVCSLLLRGGLQADNPRSNEAYETKSANEDFSISMIPEGYGGEEGRGTAYRLKEGIKTTLWSVGWFAQKVELSNSGDDLVRYGPWASDLTGWTDLAIAFYRKGKLVKQYQVKDLLKDASRLDETASHYYWQPQTTTRPVGFSADGKTYHLVMVDRTTYDFDVSTGMILKTASDPGAKNAYDLWVMERDEDAARGKKIYEASPLPSLYGPYFTAGEFEASEGKSCFLFPEPEWRASLTPRTPLACKTMVSVIYPRRPDETLGVAVTPDKMLQALNAAVGHPVMAQILKTESRAEIILDVGGDQLHQKPEYLNELIKALELTGPDLTSKPDWAQFFIRSPSVNVRFWVNLKSNHLVYWDSAMEYPWPYFFYDSKGQLIKDTRKDELPRADQDAFQIPLGK